MLYFAWDRVFIAWGAARAVQSDGLEESTAEPDVRQLRSATLRNKR